MKAIDLYSGIGGWTLGLRLAGIEVVRCYEWWDSAINTYNANLEPVARKKDIRALKPEDIDCEVGEIDVVVGSPPCTQFSYANRGGSGDISDGLQDIEKFLEIVQYFKPKVWAMENVPRVAKILESEMAPSGRLSRFHDLCKNICIVDCSEFGLPQRRKRMLAGNFPKDLLLGYRQTVSKLTLGDVVDSLSSGIDPIYGFTCSGVSELEKESVLDKEEQRLNKEAKTHHPVYNKMPFPDPLERTSRTITALCTRISRESIVIPVSEGSDEVRRLSVRERASLQGFPINYEFHGKSYPEKIKMVGNAIPPLLTYYIASSMLAVQADELKKPTELDLSFVTPSEKGPHTPPNDVGKQFPRNRSFRAAIEGLRFGSGMRFELKNSKSGDDWNIDFYFGTSKNIQSVRLDGELLNSFSQLPFWDDLSVKFHKGVSNLTDLLSKTDLTNLQKVWSRRETGVGPFIVVDECSNWAMGLKAALEAHEKEVEELVPRILGFGEEEPLNGSPKKISQYALEIFSGMIVGSWFNSQGKQILEPKKVAA